MPLRVWQEIQAVPWQVELIQEGESDVISDGYAAYLNDYRGTE